MRVCEGVGALQTSRMGIGIGDGAFSFEFENPVDGQGRRFGVEDEDEGKKAWQKDRIEGHRERICSRCCVERGAEGDVWCLGCLRTEDGMS
jgi:hypothetical protein